MPLRIIVIAEAEADRRMVCGLIDLKVTHHAPDWFDHEQRVEQLDALREWSGLEAGTLFTSWSRLKHLRQSVNTKSPGVRTLGFSRSSVRGYDGAAVRTAIILTVLHEEKTDVLLFSRDLDGQHSEQRRESIITGATDARQHGLHVFLAIQNPMREAWLLNGFHPQNSVERRALADEQKSLQFDPCMEAHRLDSSDEALPRSAKRVLRSLSGGHSTREEDCWAKADWNRMRANGVGTGLRRFLDEVKTTLVPLITGEAAQ
jgi:hypothetical protein